MGFTSKLEVRIAKALAVFDAERQLLSEGWDVESLRHLAWSVDVQPALPNDDRGFTVVPRFKDRRVRGGSGSDSLTQGSAGGRVTTNPPPMPQDREQYWISVMLHAGGNLTLGVSVNPLNLRGDDRTFFYDIVDRFNAYKDKVPP